MRDKRFSTHNTVPDVYETETSTTQRLDTQEYAEKMKARYEQFAQQKTVPKTEDDLFTVPSTPTPSRLSGIYFLVLQAQRVLKHTPLGVMAVIVGLVTLLVHGYRLSAAPDIFSDEGIYLLLGQNVAKGVGLVINHQPFFYHPPAYLLIEAAYIRLMGLTNADALTTLLSVRYLNIFFSALTASFILLFGHKLHSYKAGLIMVALFLMDPYVQRINRRNMLETLAMLCLLLGFYIFFTSEKHLTKRQWIGSGIAFGLATLTKEPMFLPLIALLGIAVWTRRTQLADAVRVIVIACLLYLAYPLGEIVSGNGSSYLAFKLSQIGSVVISITGHGLVASSQKTVSVGHIQSLSGEYASSYVLLALAGLSTIILFLRFRHLVAARYLFAWSIFSFGYVIILGRLSDQYFYFLIVPSAVIVNGYVLTEFFEVAQHRRWLSIVLSLSLCLLLLYNSSIWAVKYVYSSDNGYTTIIRYLQAHVRAGAIVDASDDVTNYLLSSTYDIRFDRHTQDVIDRHEQYFIMSSKDAWGGYNDTTPQFYNWVIHNSQPLVVEQEDTFWTIGLYYMKVPPAPAAAISFTRHMEASNSPHNVHKYFITLTDKPKRKGPSIS